MAETVLQLLSVVLRALRRDKPSVVVEDTSSERNQFCAEGLPTIEISGLDITDMFRDAYCINAKSSAFDGDDYLERYPDVAQSGIAPDAHFLRFGQYEERPVRWRSFASAIGPDRFQSLLQSRGSSRSSGELCLAEIWWGKTSRALSALDAANVGWIGSREMTNAERSPVSRRGSIGPLTLQAIQDAESAGTRLLNDSYDTSATEKVADEVSTLFISAISTDHRCTSKVPSIVEQGLSIITSCQNRLEYFSECACSVTLAIQQALQRWPSMPVEWIIAYDDKIIQKSTLIAAIPLDIHERCTFLPVTDVDRVSATNLAIGRAALGWYLFLECQDALMPRAIIAIEHYARETESRYLSSAVVDIDELGRIFRYQQHVEPASQFLRFGVLTDRLNVIHRSLFERHGPYDANFEPCHDYEFLLRVLSTDPICLMPDHLSCCRWRPSDKTTRRRAVRKSRVLAARRHHVTDVRLGIGKNLDKNLAQVSIVVHAQSLQIGPLIGTAVSALTPDPSGTSLLLVVPGTEAEARFLEQAVLTHELPAPTHMLRIDPGSKSKSQAVNLGFEHAFLRQGATAASFVSDNDVILPLHRHWAQRVKPWTARAIIGRRLRRDSAGTLSEGRRLLPLLQLTSAPTLDLAATIVSREAYRRVVEEFGEMYPADMQAHADWMAILRLIYVGTEFDLVADFVMSTDGSPEDRQTSCPEEGLCRHRVNTLVRKILNDQPSFPERSLRSFSQCLARELDQSEVTAVLATYRAEC